MGCTTIYIHLVNWKGEIYLYTSFFFIQSPVFLAWWIYIYIYPFQPVSLVFLGDRSRFPGTLRRILIQGHRGRIGFQEFVLGKGGKSLPGSTWAGKTTTDLILIFILIWIYIYKSFSGTLIQEVVCWSLKNFVCIDGRNFKIPSKIGMCRICCIPIGLWYIYLHLP